MNLKTCIVVLIFSIGLIKAQAQVAVNAAAGDAEGSGGSMSYSIGQISYKLLMADNAYMLQGVQQPIEVIEIPGTSVESEILISLDVFPNPTNETLKLQLRDLENHSLQYQLYNMNGRCLKESKIHSSITEISLEALSPAMYILNISENNQTLKSYKILKN